MIYFEQAAGVDRIHLRFILNIRGRDKLGRPDIF